MAETDFCELSYTTSQQTFPFSPGKSHEYTANPDKRMPVAMVVAMETPVDIGYGPHPGNPALPWKQGCIATIGFHQQI